MFVDVPVGMRVAVAVEVAGAVSGLLSVGSGVGVCVREGMRVVVAVDNGVNVAVGKALVGCTVAVLVGVVKMRGVWLATAVLGVGSSRRVGEIAGCGVVVNVGLRVAVAGRSVLVGTAVAGLRVAVTVRVLVGAAVAGLRVAVAV